MQPTPPCCRMLPLVQVLQLIATLSAKLPSLASPCCPTGNTPRFACPLLRYSHSAASAACRSWTFWAPCLAHQLRVHHQSHSSVSTCAHKCSTACHAGGKAQESLRELRAPSCKVSAVLNSVLSLQVLWHPCPTRAWAQRWRNRAGTPWHHAVQSAQWVRSVLDTRQSLLVQSAGSLPAIKITCCPASAMRQISAGQFTAVPHVM